MPRQVSALEMLRQVIANLPDKVRLRVTELSIGPSEVVLEGETRSYTDAETINRALARAGLAMEAPHTERQSTGGVSFTLMGKPAEGAPERSQATRPSDANRSDANGEPAPTPAPAGASTEVEPAGKAGPS